ncbi:MAG: hypothetical protein LBR31_04460 [Desulfovibrio sp.]|jgi:hypothetical protein|nr:hypothetical protein [Desulfovibrio sp.]
MSDFVPIPDYPGYSINPLGQVRGQHGGLMVNPRGQVSLRRGSGRRAVFIGALLANAGMLRSDDDAAALAKAEQRARDALSRLALAEGENKTYWKNSKRQFIC